jgi:peptide/nickel transport system substrate-binding protein
LKKIIITFNRFALLKEIKGVYVKGKKLLVFGLAVVLSASIFAGCKQTTAPVKVSANKIPPYGKVIEFDWSKLPEGQKQEYFKFQEPFIYKLLSLKVVEETDVQVPSREITRKEFIHWLVKSMGLKLVKTGAKFTDVTKDMAEFEYIMTAASNGIIEKTDTFKPEDPLLRSDAAIWLVNAKGETAKTEAAKYLEPLIPAQDGYDEVPKNAIGAMTVCIMPDFQLLQYRWKALDEYRYIRPNDPMFVVEAAYSIFMVNYPPVRGGTLTIGQAQEPKTLFSGLDTMSAMTQITSLLYEGSTGGYDEFWGRFPYMIKKIPTQENGLWKINKTKGADGKEKVTMEVTYELRKGLKWADGTEITGDDAVFSFNFYNHPSFPTIHSEMDFWVDNVVLDPKDPYKITVLWNTPYLFANAGIGIMPRAYFEKAFNYHLDNFSINDKTYYDPSKDDPKTDKVDESFKSKKFLEDEKFILQCTESDLTKNKIDYNKNPMHAGAYKVKKWEQGQTIILEPNENYIFGKPLLDSITFRTIENTDTLLAAAMAGNVDMTLTGLSFDQAKQLEKKGAEIPQKAVFTPSLTWEHLDLNIDNPELSDVRVRKALLHSIDRQAIVDNFFGGVQPVAHAWLPPKHYAFDEASITKYEFSKEKAAALFDEAGWKLNAKTGKREKDGKVFTITYMTTAQNKTREQVQAVIASGWKELGLEVTTKNEQATSFFGTTLRERKFNGAICAMYAWIMGPDSNLYSMVNSTQIPTQANGWSGQNYPSFKNAIVDKITLENQKLLDKKEVYAGLKTVQKILTDELPSLPLFYRVDVTSVHEALMNYRPTGTSSPVTWNAMWWYWNK